jgi:hypothetical protein
MHKGELRSVLVVMLVSSLSCATCCEHGCSDGDLEFHCLLKWLQKELKWKYL